MAVSRLHPAPPTHHHHQHQPHQQTQQVQPPHNHREHHHIASSLMSCVRESSPVDDLEEGGGDEGAEGPGGGGLGGGGEGRKQGRHDTKKRRFHPLRGLRRIFRRKSRRSPEDGGRDITRVPGGGAGSSALGGTMAPDDRRDTGMATTDLDEAYRSRSASELLSGEEEDEEGNPEEDNRRRSGCRTSGEIFQDSLRHSVSHDSVFSSGERRVSSGGGGNGGGSGRPPQPLAPSSSAQQVAAHQNVRAELFDAVRRRRWRGHSQDGEGDGDEVRGAAASAGRSSDEEEDLGLPRSPCNSPSSGEAGLRSDQKEIQSKSHSTCSEGSLLSMGSSDMDEDSQGHFSGHSSKLSLQEKSSSQYDLELDLGATAEPLSHSAARHKMAVRPKRTHGAPRLRRLKEVTSLGSLPTTPEVNEDSGRCTSPETSFNQETSSNEQIQVPSDIPLHKHISTSSSATEMPSRVSHSQHQSSSSGRLNASPLHLPESVSPTPKSSHHLISDSLHSVSKPVNVRPMEMYGEDAHEHRNETHGSPSKNSSDLRDWGDKDPGALEETFGEDSHDQRNETCGSSSKTNSDLREWGDKDSGAVEEVSGIEETESGGTNILSRILSWRGSKKKVDESPEGATAAVEGPSRRMDVHGRYVHEVICETEVFTGAANQTPPSPGWRPAPFSTSWPPLVHSTPRSCHTSSRQISDEIEEQRKNDTEEAMWASVEFSGPRSLPLVLQEDMVDSGDERGMAENSHQPFAHSSEPFSIKSKPRPFSSHGEAPVEVMLSKSSSMKTHHLDQHSMLTSSDSPESLPVNLERSEFDHSYALPSESFQADKAKSASVMDRDTPPRETLLKSSAEGLLTLDVNRTMNEAKPRDIVVEDRCDFPIALDEAVAENVDGWGERQREVDESLDLSVITSAHDVPQPVGTFETSVMLQHTRMEQYDENSWSYKMVDNSHLAEEIPDIPMQEQIGPTSAPEDESSAPVSSASSRYKRVQSLPNDPSVSKSPNVPEFLLVQLNHVDSRPATNVVLHSTGGVPTSVNPPELNDTPVRRRMRPHSADGLETNQTEILGPAAISRGGTGSSFNNASHDKQVGYRSRASSRDSTEVTPQVEIVRPKESSLPRTGLPKQRDLIGDKVESFEGPMIKMEDGSGQLRKSPSRDVLIVTPNENGNIPLKDAPTVGRNVRKSTEDLSNKGYGNVVTPVKDKEDSKPRPMSVRESLGVVTVQNDVNQPKDAALPPKAVRKVSGDDTSAEVVPRRKSTSTKDFGTKNKEDEPELFKVFARRSLKLKDTESWENHPPPQQQQRSRDSDKENDSGDNAIDVVIMPMSKEQKQRDSLIKGEFLKDCEPPAKSMPTHAVDTSHHLRPLQRIPSSNGIVPPSPLNTGSIELRNNSLYSNGEKTGNEGTKLHRSSVTGGSLPRREGPSPEKRPRGSSINLPPESQPVRVEINRVGIPFDPRRPSWANQLHSEGISDAFGKPSASEIPEVCRQPIDLGLDGEEDSKPHFKRIQQRKEEWELRARMQ